MGICLLSSVLAFVSGFLVSILCLVKGLVKCSDEKWQRFRDAVDEAREANNA